MIDWVECGSHAHYPTIEFGIRGASGAEQKRRRLLFDTGADNTYIADFVFPSEVYKKLLQEHSWIFGERTSPTSNGSTDTAMIRARMQVEVSDGSQHVSGTGTVFLVADWAESSFVGACAAGTCSGGAKHCANRVGLISSTLMNELNVEVSLNGRARTLQIREAADSRQTGRRRRSISSNALR